MRPGAASSAGSAWNIDDVRLKVADRDVITGDSIVESIDLTARYTTNPIPAAVVAESMFVRYAIVPTGTIVCHKRTSNVINA